MKVLCKILAEGEDVPVNRWAIFDVSISTLLHQIHGLVVSLDELVVITEPKIDRLCGEMLNKDFQCQTTQQWSYFTASFRGAYSHQMLRYQIRHRHGYT